MIIHLGEGFELTVNFISNPATYSFLSNMLFLLYFRVVVLAVKKSQSCLALPALSLSLCCLSLNWPRSVKLEEKHLLPSSKQMEWIAWNVLQQGHLMGLDFQLLLQLLQMSMSFFWKTSWKLWFHCKRKSINWIIYL